jgi:hypothetical protein
MRTHPRENVYTCRKCGGFTVTVDLDEGITPYLLACRASGKHGDCPGMAESSGYPIGPRPKHIPDPQWEWYKPGELELREASPELRDYALHGGLFLRRLGAPKSDIPSGYIRDAHGTLHRIQ